MKKLQIKTAKELLGRELDKKWVLEGLTNNEDEIIYINVEHIWNNSKSFDEFVYRFNIVFTHEKLHLLINRECLNSWLPHNEVGDEIVIRKMLGEPFKEEIKTYKKVK